MIFHDLKLIITFTALFYFSHSNAEENFEVDPKHDKSRTATLVIYRSKASPPINYKPLISINGLKAFHLTRGYHAVLTLEEGAVSVFADWKIMHGVPDSNLSVDLKAGKVTYIEISNSLELSYVGGANFNPASKLVASKSTIDLSNSTQVTRWHRLWLRNGMADGEPPTLTEKYELTVNFEKLIKDIGSTSLDKQNALMAFIVRHDLYEEEVLLAIEQEILRHYKKTGLTKYEIRSLAQMCKTVSASSKLEFKSLIIEVKNEASEDKIRSYAKKYLNKYF